MNELPLDEHRLLESEKAALEGLLRSGLFDRAPGLGRLLQYVCQKYFDGQAEQIKEYNIAVEALGRPANFDQKKDSIVRVEAHRLRKRLQQYYAGDGERDEIQISIPEGRYVPRFVHREPVEGVVAPEAEPVANVVTAAEPKAVELERPRRRMARWVSGAAAAITLVVSAWWVMGKQAASTAGPAQAGESRIAAGKAGAGRRPIRIRAGTTTEFADALGRVWSADHYYRGGEAVTPAVRVPVKGLDPGLFASRRQGAFRYDIPVGDGEYEVRLYFAEVVFGEGNTAGGGETSRVFNVLANGTAILREFDVISDAGGSRVGDVRAFGGMKAAADGYLHLEFQPLKNELPFVNAIEVLPTERGRVNPIRMVARDKQYKDAKGVEWIPDYYASGGVRIWRPELISGADDPERFQGERFGNFTYSIAMPRGRYSVTLYFAEQWFGEGMPGGGGKGSRLFSVAANQRVLLENFDIHAEAGGALRPVKKTFTGVTPDPQGKIVLRFQPSVNYACINAIEIVDEGDGRPIAPRT